MIPRKFNLILVFCFFLFINGAVAQAADTPKVLRMRLDQQIDNFDTGRSTGHMTSAIARIVYDYLLDYKPGAWPELIPKVITKFDVSSDGLTYTFYLKKGVKWQKGFGELTAEDVKFTVERVLDPKTKSPFKTVWEPVIERIETPDKYTVKFVLKKFDPAFLYKIAPWRAGAILCKKAVEKYGENYGKSGEATVGCGPFELVEWIPKQKAVFQRFKDYHGKKPALDRIDMLEISDQATAVLSLQKGELDMCYIRAPEDLPIVQKDPNLKVYHGRSGLILGCVGFNMEHPILKDIRVRRAMAHALDRDLIAKEVVGELGEKACGWLSPGAYIGALTCSDLPQYPYDPEKAKKLLAEAGYPNGFKIKFYSYNFKPYKDLPPVLQAYWKEIGIDLEIELLGAPDFFAKAMNAELPIFEDTFGTRPPEPSIFLYTIFHSSSSKPGLNWTLYKGVDDLLDKALGTRKESERIELYKQIQKKIIEDCVIVPLYFDRMIMATRKNVDLGRGAKGNELTSPYWHFYWLEEITLK